MDTATETPAQTGQEDTEDQGGPHVAGETGPGTTPTGGAPGSGPPPAGDTVLGKAAPPATGAAGAKPAKLYDFRQPGTLDRAQLRTLRLLFDPYTHRVGGALTSSLRSPVRVKLGELEQHTWDDYSSKLPESTVLVSVSMVPLTGRVVLHLPLALALCTVELRLGGTPSSRFPERQLTEIESKLVADVADGILDELPPMFAPVAALRIAHPQQVVGVQFLQAVRPGEMCLLVNLELETADGLTFPFSLCFPLTMVHPIADSLTSHDSDDSGSGAGDEELLVHRVLNLPVNLSVTFPPTTLTPAEFLDLAIGDVIRLPYEQGSPLSLMAGGFPYLDVLPTVHGKRLACVITDEDEEYEA